MGNKNSGPRPRPTALKVLRGVTRKDRINPAEPIPPPGTVVKPGRLSPGAALVWDEMAPVALAMGLLTTADVWAFEHLCELEDTYNVNRGKKGDADYSTKDEIALIKELRQEESRFGFDPSSRAKLQVSKKAEAPVSKWAGALK